MMKLEGRKKYLKVEFWSDSHEKIHVQVIVVSDERLGSCSTGNHVHHWSFHFKETEIVEELADVGDDLRTDKELFAHIRVNNQVQVPLTEASFLKTAKHIMTFNYFIIPL